MRHQIDNCYSVELLIFLISLLILSIITPQDAHKRLVMQVAEWLTASLYQCSREVSDMS